MNNHIIANPLETGDDELERYALEECIKRQRIDHAVSVLVLPGGRCEQAFKFARLGAHVCIADEPAQQRDIEGRILAAGLRDNACFAPYTLPELPDCQNERPFDIIVFRRGLYTLPYPQGKQLVRHLMQKLKIGGKLFISILGLHSELGEGYAGYDQSIYERFAPLSPAMAGKYGLHEPICLYSERDLFLLLLESGASVLRTLTTTYGNVKGIAVRV